MVYDQKIWIRNPIQGEDKFNNLNQTIFAVFFFFSAFVELKVDHSMSKAGKVDPL